jgi:hypothetical protein
MFGSGGGCEYSVMFSRQRSDSVISFSGRKGNFLWSIIGVGGVSWLCINLYNSVCIEFWDLLYLGYLLRMLYMGVVLGCAVQGGC